MRDTGEKRQKLQALAYGDKDFDEIERKTVKTAKVNIFLIAFIIVSMLIIMLILNTDMEYQSFKNALNAGNKEQVVRLLDNNPTLAVREETIKEQTGKYSFTTTSTGKTPLHKASGSGYAEIAQILISRGAEVNKTEHLHGRTPLHMVVSAPKNSSVKTAKVLLKAGANLEITDRQNYTPLDLAKNVGKDELVELFTSHMENHCSP
jgi:ankyrin repeat protein